MIDQPVWLGAHLIIGYIVDESPGDVELQVVGMEYVLEHWVHRLLPRVG